VHRRANRSNGLVNPAPVLNEVVVQLADRGAEESLDRLLELDPELPTILNDPIYVDWMAARGWMVRAAASRRSREFEYAIARAKSALTKMPPNGSPRLVAELRAIIAYCLFQSERFEDSAREYRQLELLKFSLLRGACDVKKLQSKL
jgi:hypothetical protein